MFPDGSGAALIAAVAAVVVSLISGWVAMNARKIAPYEALAARVSVLEARIETLENELRIAHGETTRWRSYAMTLFELLVRHHIEPPTMPGSLTMEVG